MYIPLASHSFVGQPPKWFSNQRNGYLLDLLVVITKILSKGKNSFFASKKSSFYEQKLNIASKKGFFL